MQSVKSRLEETRSRSIGLEEVWAGTSLAGRLCEVPTPVEKLRTLEVFLARRLHPGKKQAVYAGPDGVVMHSQLTFGTA